MLSGKILRSPYAHARILHIDTSRAERLPGVKAVVTGKDTAGVRYGVFPHTRDELALTLDKVRYVGDEVAAVAAVDEDTAQEALGLIRVEYELLPAVFDPFEAMREGAPQLHDHAPGNVAVHVRIPFGDLEAGLAQCYHVREDHFETQPISHCQVEPYAVVASFEGGKLEVWVPNASPFTRKRGLSTLLRIPMDRVQVHQVFIGGHFGGRSELMSGDYGAALLSMKTGRPVRIVYSREETFCNTRQKHPFLMDIKTGVGSDGAILAQSIRAIADGGAYVSTGAIAITCPAVMLLSVYRVPHFLYEGYRVYSNKPPCGAMRGHGNQQIRFAIESQLDMIAQDMGMDPVEIRLRNVVETGEILPYRSRVTSCGLEESIHRVVQSSGFSQRWGRPDQDRGVGVGVASVINGFGMGVRTLSSAFIKFNEDGQTTLLTGIVDNGQGNVTMAAQIAAEELGVRVEDVLVVNADTAVTPQDPGSYSMQSTFTGGNAVKAAAGDAKRQLFDIASQMLEANPGDLEAQEGRIYVRGSPERAVSIKDAVWNGLARGRPVLGRGYYKPPVDAVDWFRGRIEGQVTGTYTFGTTVAQVGVDRETGQVTVLEVAAAHDCGLAINPMLVEGQIEGSVFLGQGQALSEDVVQESGSVLNADFASYGFPTTLDMPRMHSIIVEARDPDGPFGAKEAAESINIAIIPAIANAVSDAAGVRLDTLPLSPEKVLKALAEDRK
jgi:4-hydroxybenzoyl-CoA reductase subunit alpha